MIENATLPRRQLSRPVNARQHLLNQMSDEDLMEQFQAGTVEAFNLLVGRYSERLMRYLYGFLGDVKRCEDLLQETFLRVHRNRHSYQRIAKFSTWLYTIAGNLARSEYRKRKRRRLYSLQSTNRDDEEYEVEIGPVDRSLPQPRTEGLVGDCSVRSWTSRRRCAQHSPRRFSGSRS